MSIKRQATTDLNHDNWDQEDPSEHEEKGTFQTAAKEVLEKRVIRTAKRRVQTSGDEPKKSVFSSFEGFKKTQPSSFDFLANLTNGNKGTNGSSEKPEPASSTNIFGSKPAASGGLFGMPTSSSSNAKTTFGTPTSQTSSLFTGTSSSSTTVPFGSSGDGPFKIQTTNSKVDTLMPTSAPKSEPSTIFGNASSSKSIFGGNNSTSSSFKINTTNTITTNSDDGHKSEEPDDKKMRYYSKLRGLNESVSDWIRKNVDATPLCILSPIFKDYEKYLKEIQDEYFGTNQDIKSNVSDDGKEAKQSSQPNVSKSSTGMSGSSLPADSKPIFGSQNVATDSNKPSGFSFGIKTSTSDTSATQTNANESKNTNTSSNQTLAGGLSFGTNTAAKETSEKPGGFSFGNNTSTSSATTTAGGFSFGLKTTATTTSPPSLFTTNTTTSSIGAGPFSFGLGKPFSFSSNIQTKSEEKAEENEQEEEPPKVEFTPVVEENSVFDKKCKIFVKKDNNFVDKGVGTLYIKKVKETSKHQLLVRANTNLGTVLLNMILSSGIPTQRLGKNNVMMVCLPTPDHKPPPTPVLIRVKTAEEADELLETLNKFKS